MDDTHPFWRMRSFTVAPASSRQGYRAEIKDAGGGTIATCDQDGVVTDASGTTLVTAPVRWESKPNRPIEAEIQIVDPDGISLGSGGVVKYGIGPRSKKATVAIMDSQGKDAVRLEPTDKKGEQLNLSSEAGTLATITVAEEKTGFLRKSRLYRVEVTAEVTEALRPLVLAAAVRYDALLEALTAGAMRDSMRR